MMILKRPDLRYWFGDAHDLNQFDCDGVLERLDNEHYFGAVESGEFYSNVYAARIDSAESFAYDFMHLVEQVKKINDPALLKLIKPALSWCEVDNGFQENHYDDLPTFPEGIDLPAYAFDAMCAHYFIRMCADSTEHHKPYYRLLDALEKLERNQCADYYFKLRAVDETSYDYNHDDVLVCALLSIVRELRAPFLYTPYRVDFSKAYKMDLSVTIRKYPHALPEDYLCKIYNLDPSNFGRKNYPRGF